MMTFPPIPDPREQVLPVAENLFKALLLSALLLASFYAADRIAATLDTTAALPRVAALALKWSVVVPLGVFDVVVLTGMGVLAHEAVHRVLFRSAFWNEFWGGLLSALTLIPFYANRQFHLTHHSYAHQPGLDPENTMHHRPFMQAATLGGLIGLQEQYRILFASIRRMRDRRYALRALRDCACLLVAGAVYFRLVPALGISLAVSVLPMILLFPLVFAFRALSDHYGIPPLERGSRTREEVLDADTHRAGRPGANGASVKSPAGWC